jgi:hypothetical protein
VIEFWWIDREIVLMNLNTLSRILYTLGQLLLGFYVNVGRRNPVYKNR